MNKLNLLCALSCTAVLTVCGTNAYAADQGAIPVKTAAVSQSENTKSFAVNKVVYEGTNVILSCREIFKDGIEFEVTNTSDSSISLILNIGLDGYSAKLWGDAYEWEIAPNETKVCKMNGDIPHPEHALMSMYGIVFKDYTGIEEFDIYDFDLGGKPNTDAAYPEGTEQFSSDDLTVDYIGADARGVNFAVSNKRDCSITVGFETFTINNDIRNYAISVTTIPPHTEGVYLVDILSYNPAYFSNELKSFEGIMYTVINGNRIDRFPVSSENSGKEAGSNSTQDISEAEKVYNMSLQLHKDQCSKDPSGRYSYDGITFLEDDCNWIDSPLNKDGTVDAAYFTGHCSHV